MLDDSVQRCDAAPNCFYTPPSSFDLIGTHPNDADTDDDGVDDNVEISTGWTVTVYNSDSYQVFSNPVAADFDNDGLNDSEEQTEGTDPNVSDTDGDTRNDGDEIADSFDPLRKDYSLILSDAPNGVPSCHSWLSCLVSGRFWRMVA